jgi:hypothetical protein
VEVSLAGNSEDKMMSKIKRILKVNQICLTQLILATLCCEALCLPKRL